MSEIIEQTTQGKTVTKFLSGVLSVQTVMYILAGFVAAVLFWKQSHDNWDETKAMKEQIEILKDKMATKEDVKSVRAEIQIEFDNIKERAQRQFTRIGELDARIDKIDQQTEYSRGFNDGVHKH